MTDTHLDALTDALTHAADLAGTMETRYLTFAPDRLTVSVSVDEETGRPRATLELDNTDGQLGIPDDRLENIGWNLGLGWGDAGRYWREWVGQHRGSDVALVLYLPDPEEDRTRVDRARDYLRQLGYAVRHDPALNATLAATALLGAGAALAARRALTR